MKVFITKIAETDLRHIDAYISDDNPKAAANFLSRLTEQFAMLGQFPGLGRKRDEIKVGYRSITEGDYLILYRLVSQTELEIVRVVHSKMDLRKAIEGEAHSE